jgi:hypothetical protein
VRTFAQSLVLYLGLFLLASAVVFPLYPSDVPLLVLLMGGIIFIVRRELSKGKAGAGEAGSGESRTIIKLGAVSLAAVAITVAVLVFSQTSLGPMLAAISLAYFLSLYLSKKRVSIFSGAIIWALLLAAGFSNWAKSEYRIMEEENEIFLSLYLVYGSLAWFLGSAAVIRTVSVSGMTEGETRPFRQSLFPMVDGWRNRWRTSVEEWKLNTRRF